MAPPSQLSIATSTLLRLVKEEASYHKELEQQLSHIKKLEQEEGDENAEYVLKQEKKGVEETKAIFPQLKERIEAAMEKLEMHLQDTVNKSTGSESQVEETTKAKEAMAQAKISYREIA